MASYQVPQFLDSGDKILGPLNMRQFGYAMFGFIICVIIYGLITSLVPGLGIYALIPCLPIAVIFGYVALGQFNGRDAEIYVFKYMLYTMKPRQMIYTRVPFDTDLQVREAEFTFPKILERWKSESALSAVTSVDAYHEFNTQDANSRTRKIRDLGNMIDLNRTNTMVGIRAQELSNVRREALLQASTTKMNSNQSPTLPQSNNTRIPTQVVKDTKTRVWQQNQNFFDDTSSEQSDNQ